MTLLKQLFKAKKLASVLATFFLVILAGKKDDMDLNQVRCIYYLLCFRKSKKSNIQTLIKSGSKINAMTPVYTAKLSLKAQHTNIAAQKIDGSYLKIFIMVSARFLVEDKLRRPQFF